MELFTVIFCLFMVCHAIDVAIFKWYLKEILEELKKGRKKV